MQKRYSGRDTNLRHSPVSYTHLDVYKRQILDALATVRYPGTGKNLVEAERCV